MAELAGVGPWKFEKSTFFGAIGLMWFVFIPKAQQPRLKKQKRHSFCWPVPRQGHLQTFDKNLTLFHRWPLSPEAPFGLKLFFQTVESPLHNRKYLFHRPHLSLEISLEPKAFQRKHRLVPAAIPPEPATPPKRFPVGVPTHHRSPIQFRDETNWIIARNSHSFGKKVKPNVPCPMVSKSSPTPPFRSFP